MRTPTYLRELIRYIRWVGCHAIGLWDNYVVKEEKKPQRRTPMTPIYITWYLFHGGGGVLLKTFLLHLEGDCWKPKLFQWSLIGKVEYLRIPLEYTRAHKRTYTNSEIRSLIVIRSLSLLFARMVITAILLKVQWQIRAPRLRETAARERRSRFSEWIPSSCS